MGVLGADPSEAEPARLALERDRVCDRLRSMSLVRLAAPLADGRTRAQAGHAVAQELADLTADASGAARRNVPVLPDHAVGDQVAVMVNDLLAMLATGDYLTADQSAQLCQHAVAALTRLRQVL